MLNVNELELKHKKYKRSSYYPHLIIIATIVIALLSILLFTLYNENIEIKEQTTITQLQNTPVIEQNSSKEENITPILESKKVEDNNSFIEEKRATLDPSFGFINKIESNSITKHQPTIISDIEEIEVERIEQIIKQMKPKEQDLVESKIEIVEKSIPIIEDKKGSINIERKDEQNDIADVIKRFEINRNPALGLFIAKKYYQAANYEQAYNYALMTNDINNNIEGSWIIFAKSLVKINKKELAIETLKKYISHSNSSQAKQLLDEITSGKFK